MITETTPKNEVGNFDFSPSETIKIKVGCGNLYVIIVSDEKKRFRRLFIPRNSKFHCPLVVRYHLERLATFEAKRDLSQAIKDLRGEKPYVNKVGHYCPNYNPLFHQATSCFDAVSQALEKWRGK